MVGKGEMAKGAGGNWGNGAGGQGGVGAAALRGGGAEGQRSRGAEERAGSWRMESGPCGEGWSAGGMWELMRAASDGLSGGGPVTGVSGGGTRSRFGFNAEGR